MAVVKMAEAARLAGVSRSTLYRMVEDGKLSKSDDGVEVSELMRVFGELKMPSEAAEPADPGDSKPASADGATEPSAAVLQERVKGLEAVIEELRTQLKSKDAELRARLQEKDERIEDLLGQVRLLALPLLAAPESALKAERRGILQRIFGRG